MDATNLITPSDTKTTIKHTHHFMIANVVIIILTLVGTIGWLAYAKENSKYPYEKYVRATGPPGTVKWSSIIHPKTGTTGAAAAGAAAGGATAGGGTGSLGAAIPPTTNGGGGGY